MLLDEPTANLDPLSISNVERLISQIIRELDTTIVMSTHDMFQGQRLADRIGVIISGKMLQTSDSAGGGVSWAATKRTTSDHCG